MKLLVCMINSSCDVKFQGYGMYCLEQLRYTPEGKILSQGPGFYKVPSVGNIPREFNVRLLKESYNDKAVYSSKVSRLN